MERWKDTPGVWKATVSNRAINPQKSPRQGRIQRGGSGARSPSPMTMGASAPKAQKCQYPSFFANNNQRAALRANRAHSLVGGSLSHHRQGRHLHLWAPFLPDDKLRGRHFSGLEGAQLWLRNSEAAFASWGAVFTWLGALGRFFILRGCMVVVEELRGGIHILGAPF